jgi:hypothetical protein
MPESEVVNFSVGGYEFNEERLLFQRFGVRYQPNLVLQGVCVGNDFWGDPELLPVSYRGITLGLKQGWAAWAPHNFLIRQWGVNVFVWLRNQYHKRQEPALATPTGFMAHTEFLRIERTRLAICLRAIQTDSAFWGRAADLLDQTLAEVRKAGAQYSMVIHPEQFQVEPQIFAEVCRVYQLNPQDYDLDQPQKFLQSYCHARGLPCLDLLPIFRQKGAQGGLYLTNDTHYNPEGNRIAGEALFDFFMAHKLIQKAP